MSLQASEQNVVTWPAGVNISDDPAMLDENIFLCAHPASNRIHPSQSLLIQ
jgi:hypothetical protein